MSEINNDPTGAGLVATIDALEKELQDSNREIADWEEQRRRAKVALDAARETYAQACHELTEATARRERLAADIIAKRAANTVAVWSGAYAGI